MNYWLYFIFFLLSFGQLQRVSFLARSVNIYLFEAGVAGFVLWGIFKTKRRLIKTVKTSPFKNLVIFFVYLLFSFFISWKSYSLPVNTVGLLYLFRLALYFSYFIVLQILFSRNQITSKSIFKSIQILSILTIFFSYTQYLLYPDLRNIAYLGWDPHSHRAFGLFFDTTVAGVIYSILFFTNLFYWRKTKDKRTRKVLLIEALLLLALILLTYSRIVYLSLIVSGLYYLGRRFSWKIKAAAVALFLLLILLLPHFSGESTNLMRTTTIQARINDYQEGLKLWQKNPIIGVGYNRIRTVRDLADTGNHAGAGYPSSYLVVLVSSGILGLILLANFMFSLFKYYDHNGKTILIFLLIASFFDNILLQNFVLFILLTISFNLFHKSWSNLEN